MKRFIVFVPVILAAALETGCATPATAGHPGTSPRSEVQATRILDRHRARREFPGAVLALRDPSGATVTVTTGGAGPAPGAAPNSVTSPGPISILASSPEPMGYSTGGEPVSTSSRQPSKTSVAVWKFAFDFTVSALPGRTTCPSRETDRTAGSRGGSGPAGQP